MSETSFDNIIERERGLRRELSARRLTMIAIGGAIGTGLFLGSGFAISLAGPGVLVSYAFGALIALLLMGCLAEMTVAHPTSGSFGVYAEYYLGPLAGFLVRYAYWTCIVLAVGTEVTAVALYMRFWFPTLPGWLWIVAFSGLLIGVNARSVNVFGAVEYWFSAVKVTAIVVFIVLASYIVWRAPSAVPAAAADVSARGGAAAIGFRNYTAHGGFPAQGRVGRVGGGDRRHIQLPEHRDDRRRGGGGRATRDCHHARFSLDGVPADPVLSADARPGAGDRAVDRGGHRGEPVREGHASAAGAGGRWHFQPPHHGSGAGGDQQSALHHHAHDVQPVTGASGAAALRPPQPARRTGAGAVVLEHRHRACDRAQHRGAEVGVHSDGVNLRLWRHVYLDDDFHHPLSLSPRACAATGCAVA